MLDEASFLTFCSFCDEMSNIIGNKQSPEQILPTIKIGSLKGLDAEKIYQRGLNKRNNNLTELQCICNCTIMKAMRRALQSNMIKVAASGTVSYLHASHTKSRALRVRNVPKWLLRIQANPIKSNPIQYIVCMQQPLRFPRGPEKHRGLRLNLKIL